MVLNSLSSPACYDDISVDWCDSVKSSQVLYSIQKKMWVPHKQTESTCIKDSQSKSVQQHKDKVNTASIIK